MLYDRVASLIVGKGGEKGKEFAGFRTAFSIEKGSSTSPNKCVVKVWNLSETTRTELSVIGNVCVLKAGYKQDIGAVQIFAGDVVQESTVRDGADWITTLELMDGLVEFRDTKISVSYGAGSSGVQVLRDIAKRFGLPMRTCPNAQDRPYPSGYAFVGRLRDAMDNVCNYLGLEWSIQQREVQIIKKGGVYQRRAAVLSPTTGLIGSPEPEGKSLTDRSASPELQASGIRAVSLLRPDIEPGGYVNVQSKTIDGKFYRVESLTHVGDTHGPDWHTKLTLRNI